MLDDLNPPRVNACSCGVESRETAVVFNAKGGDISGALTGGDEEFSIRRDVERAGDFFGGDSPEGGEFFRVRIDAEGSDEVIAPVCEVDEFPRRMDFDIRGGVFSFVGCGRMSWDGLDFFEGTFFLVEMVNGEGASLLVASVGVVVTGMNGEVSWAGVFFALEFWRRIGGEDSVFWVELKLVD